VKEKKIWIVEVKTPRGWDPCYASQVNGLREFAEEDRKRLAELYKASEYRVAKYWRKTA
jgi:hypothetical protein